MSRKTKARRARLSRRGSSPRRVDVRAVPKVGRPLSLVCGACGASGRYNVGTVILDPTVSKSSEGDAIGRAVGFTGYFRCRKCDAGGPWELPPATFMSIAAMAVAEMSGIEDVPLILGGLATFDKKVFRYATECEAHLKELIDAEPERAFLWVRLGNLYNHADQKERAEETYERAIQVDPKGIEAHSMLGQLLFETNRPLEAVPHFHAVLRHVREAHDVPNKLRRELAREAIEQLLRAHAMSKGQIDLLPTIGPDEMAKAGKDEPVVLELREFDLGTEEGINELCDAFLGEPRSNWRNILSRRTRPVPDSSDDWAADPVRREELTVGRNDQCPCGSGRKYKKCCGR